MQSLPASPLTRSKLNSQCWFAFLVAVTVWACCAYSHFGKMISEGQFFSMGNAREGVQTNDSVLFYAGGQMAKDAFLGKAPLYDSDKFRLLIDRLIAPLKVEERVQLQYPPHFFLLLTPLPSFSLTGAWIFQSILSAVCLVLALKYACFAGERSTFARALIVAMGFMWYPTYWCFRLGQYSLVLLLAVAVAWYLLRKQRFAAAGFVTALAVVKVQYLPILAIAGLVQGGWKYGKGMAAGVAANAVFCLACFGTTNILAFPNALFSGEHANGARPYMMDTFRGLLSIFPNLLPEKASTIVSYGLLLLGVVVVAYLWKTIYPKLKETTFPAYELCASITMILLLVTSLHSFIQDYALMVIAAVWSYQANRSIVEADPKQLLPKITNGLLLALPAVSWVYGYLPLICFAFKLMLWCALGLLISNTVLLRAALLRVEKK